MQFLSSPFGNRVTKTNKQVRTLVTLFVVVLLLSYLTSQIAPYIFSSWVRTEYKDLKWRLGPWRICTEIPVADDDTQTTRLVSDDDILARVVSAADDDDVDTNLCCTGVLDDEVCIGDIWSVEDYCDGNEGTFKAMQILSVFINILLILPLCLIFFGAKRIRSISIVAGIIVLLLGLICEATILGVMATKVFDSEEQEKCVSPVWKSGRGKPEVQLGAGWWAMMVSLILGVIAFCLAIAILFAMRRARKAYSDYGAQQTAYSLSYLPYSQYGLYLGENSDISIIPHSQQPFYTTTHTQQYSSHQPTFGYGSYDTQGYEYDIGTNGFSQHDTVPTAVTHEYYSFYSSPGMQ